MKIAIGSDHAGFQLKSEIIKKIKRLGHKVHDVGTFTANKPSDYPDYAKKVVEKILSGETERGIIICGSGVGASIVANRFPQIRAGLCHDTYSARQCVEHNNVNVLCLGSRVIGQSIAEEIVAAFLNARFSGEKRHVQRLDKIKYIENSMIKELES
jgi:ribose 5-phosphate isomerase B